LLLSNELTEIDVNNYLNYRIETYSKNLRNNIENEIDWSKVPSEVFIKILYASVAKFPDMKKENYSDEDFNFVKKGLPELKDKQEAFVIKKHVVVDYLEILIGKKIRNEVKLYLSTQKKSKPQNIDSYKAAYNGLNPTEQSCAAAYPTGALDVEKARTQAVAYFGDHIDNTPTNARFHAFWAAGMVKEICHTTLNKWKGLDRGKKFATAHEYDKNNVLNCSNSPGHVAIFNVRIYGNCNYMDLNNNLVGRTYMYNTVGQTFIGNANNIPSWATIFNYVGGLSSTHKPNAQTASDFYSSYTIDNIGDYLNAYDYYTPTTGQLVHLVQ
jgi:hypothetical protein